MPPRPQANSVQFAAADRFDDGQPVLSPAFTQLARGVERLFRDRCLSRHFKLPSDICCYLLSLLYENL
jgi:hypothetical protein